MQKKLPGGSWRYEFDLPGSTRRNRKRETKAGFKTKGAAKTAEEDRRGELKAEAKRAATGIGSSSRTLGDLMQEFLKEHFIKLESKTIERYTDHARYISPTLCALPFDKLTSPQFTREWNRLEESGGHTREKKVRKTRRAIEFTIEPGHPRPMAPKTVRTIAGFVSSVYSYAISTLGIATFNPVTLSKKPEGSSKRQIALTPAATKVMIDGQLLRKDNTPRQRHWTMPEIMTTNNALGSRRGETLALQWPDLVDDVVHIHLSLSQTKMFGLEIKKTKTKAGNRGITAPPELMAIFERQRERQAIWKAQYGADYKRQHVNPDGSVIEIDLIFCNEDGSPLKPNSISATASNRCRKLGLPKGVSLHTLRHTHGSQMLAAGAPLPAVSARLGHSTPAMTAAVYAHALPEDDRKAMEIWQAQQVGYANV